MRTRIDDTNQETPDDQDADDVNSMSRARDSLTEGGDDDDDELDTVWNEWMSVST